MTKPFFTLVSMSFFFVYAAPPICIWLSGIFILVGLLHQGYIN